MIILDLPFIWMGFGLIWMGSGLTELPSMPQIARCLWGGGFTSTLTIAGNLRNRGSWLSPQALRVEVVDAGSLDSNLTHQSQHPPAPASWRCGFATYGTGDGCDCACGAHDPDCDDTSTGNLGAQLGAWNCMPGQVCVAPGVCSGDVARVQLRGLGLAAVRTSSGSSAPSLSQTPTESIAASIPSITSFVAADPNDGDSVASVGDTLTIHFDGVTNYAAGALRGNRSFVDDIFRFSTALGNDYTGEWVASSMVDASQSLASERLTSMEDDLVAKGANLPPTPRPIVDCAGVVVGELTVGVKVITAIATMGKSAHSDQLFVDVTELKLKKAPPAARHGVRLLVDMLGVAELEETTPKATAHGEGLYALPFSKSFTLAPLSKLAVKLATALEAADEEESEMQLVVKTIFRSGSASTYGVCHMTCSDDL